MEARGADIVHNWLFKAEKADKENTVKNYFNSNWAKGLDNLLSSPQAIWNLACPGSNYGSPQLSADDKDRLDRFVPSVFLDILCEAIFDDEKRQKQEKGRREQ